MTTNAKLALIVMALGACSAANATLTPAISSSPGSNDLINTTTHSVTVVARDSTKPIVFTDMTPNTKIAAGDALAQDDIIQAVKFTAKKGHLYELGGSGTDAKYSFSTTSSAVAGTTYVELSGADNDTDAYVLITKATGGTLSRGEHVYTFTVSDYHA